MEAFQDFNLRSSCISSFSKCSDGGLLEIRSFKPIFNPEYVTLAEAYRKKLLSSEESVTNYNEKNLIFKEQKVVTLFIKEGTIVGFCTAWKRACYPPQTVRILNRFWFDAVLRRKQGTKLLMKLPIVLAVEHQCFILKKMGIFWVFISRPFHSTRWCDKICKELNEKSRFTGWRNPDALFLVCPDPTHFSCWQIIVYSNLTGDKKKCFSMEFISRRRFFEKFKKTT